MTDPDVITLDDMPGWKASTDIQIVRASKANSQMYDLSGRAVSVGYAKGIVMMNNKKVLFKKIKNSTRNSVKDTKRERDFVKFSMSLGVKEVTGQHEASTRLLRLRMSLEVKYLWELKIVSTLRSIVFNSLCDEETNFFNSLEVANL